MAAGAYGDRHPRTYLKRHFAGSGNRSLEQDSGSRLLLSSRQDIQEHWEILTELGQFQDDDEIRETAIAICEHKLKSKEAVTLLRRWRNGKSASGDLTALAEEIAKVIRYYKLRYPDTTDQQVRWAYGTSAKSSANTQKLSLKMTKYATTSLAIKTGRRDAVSTPGLRITG